MSPERLARPDARDPYDTHRATHIEHRVAALEAAARALGVQGDQRHAGSYIAREKALAGVSLFAVAGLART